MEVQIVFRDDEPDMPEPPNLAVDGRVPGKDITAGQLEAISPELLPE